LSVLIKHIYITTTQTIHSGRIYLSVSCGEYTGAANT